MINFREFRDTLEIQELAVDIEEYFENGDIEVIYEGASSKAWATAASLFLHSKVNTIHNKVKDERDVSKKLDLIADQNKWLAAFVNLGIATTLGDKTVYKKTK